MVTCRFTARTGTRIPETEAGASADASSCKQLANLPLQSAQTQHQAVHTSKNRQAPSVTAHVAGETMNVRRHASRVTAQQHSMGRVGWQLSGGKLGCEDSRGLSAEVTRACEACENVQRSPCEPDAQPRKNTCELAKAGTPAAAPLGTAAQPSMVPAI
jgi:hypothetical protein